MLIVSKLSHDACTSIIERNKLKSIRSASWGMPQLQPNVIPRFQVLRYQKLILDYINYIGNCIIFISIYDDHMYSVNRCEDKIHCTGH